MRRKPRILIDCDGVLADFLLLYLELHAQLNGRVCVHADVTDFDLAKCVATVEEDERIWRHIDRTHGLVRELSPLDGALDGLRALRSLGEVVCVTSPHIGPTWMHERARWLIDRAGFKKREIIFASAKEIVPGDCLIDDKLEQVIAWDREHVNGWGVVFNAPHNQGEIGTCLRARNWLHLVQVMHGIFGEQAAAWVP